MPKLGPRDHAVRRFRKPIERALRCIAPVWITLDQVRPDADDYALDLDPLRLTGRTSQDVYLVITHGYRLVEEPEAGWHVSTTGYAYVILDADQREMCSWHWHPHVESQPRPHLHVKQHPQLSRIHLPTSRVSIESVIRVLVDDFGAAPAAERASDYAEVLDETERDFIQHRRWHVSGPGDASAQ